MSNVSPKESVSIREVMICWNSTLDESGHRFLPSEDIGLVRWPDKARRSNQYGHSVGACFTKVHEFGRHELLAYVGAELLTILRYGVTPDALHTAMLPLVEYRDLLPLDALGDDYWHRVERERRETE